MYIFKYVRKTLDKYSCFASLSTNWKNTTTNNNNSNNHTSEVLLIYFFHFHRLCEKLNYFQIASVADKSQTKFI